MRLIHALKWCAVSVEGRIKRVAFPASKQCPAPDEERRWELDAGQTAALYRAQANERPDSESVDDRTWAELEMDKVFVHLDKSVTPLGAQSLYALLREYLRSKEQLELNRHLYQVFTANPDAGQRLRKALRTLNAREVAELADFLFGAPPSTPRRYRAFYAASALAVVCPFGLLISPWFLFFCLALWISNIVVHSVYSQRLGVHTPALASLARLLGCVPAVTEAVQALALPEVSALASIVPIAQKLRSKISRVFLRTQDGNDLSRAAMEYLNLLCLFELSYGCSALLAIRQHRTALMQLLRLVGRLDAFQGLARTFSQYPLVCAPELKPGRSFAFVEVYHPLVARPVSTTIHSTGRSVLLSGSNMSGKTTFMKTLATNVIFAQTIGYCLARSVVLPPATVKTLIGREDNVIGAQSYFYFEASELLRMVGEVDANKAEYWLFIDEIFRGTNTIERVAAGSAVLRHLTSRALVFASTHDHELMEGLRDQFEAYHFSECVNGGAMHFDYQLRKGPCLSRNAIQLLVLAGYPKEVTDIGQAVGRTALSVNDCLGQRRLCALPPSVENQLKHSASSLPLLNGLDRVEEHDDVQRQVVSNPVSAPQFHQEQ